MAGAGSTCGRTGSARRSARLPALTVLAIPHEAGRTLAALADKATPAAAERAQEQQVYLS